MQAVETCWNTDLTWVQLMIMKPLEQTMDGGHPPGALVAASGRESASDWVVSLGKRRFPNYSHFDPPFDNAFPTFKSMTDCLCIHTFTYSFNMGGTCITKISKILCDDEINASLVWSVYLAQFPAESLPLFWELHPSWSPIHSPTSVGSSKNGNVGVKLPIFPHKINRQIYHW